MATTPRFSGSVVFFDSAPVDDFLGRDGRLVIVATARRYAGTAANLPVEGQDGAKFKERRVSRSEASAF